MADLRLTTKKLGRDLLALQEQMTAENNKVLLRVITLQRRISELERLLQKARIT